MRIKRGVVCKVPGWEPCGLLTNVTLPLFITSHPGPYTANWMVISFNFKRYRYKNAHNGQEITESHNGMAWTGENGQSGSTMQYPGDALRPEFGTQKVPDRACYWENTKVRTVLGSLQRAGPSRATPPKSVSSCAKWGFKA